MPIQKSLVLLLMQSQETQEYQFNADVDVLDSLTWELYVCTLVGQQYTASGSDIATVSNVSVTATLTSNGTYNVVCRFDPSQITPPLAQLYGLIVSLNNTDTATTKQRQYTIIFQIRDFLEV